MPSSHSTTMVRPRMVCTNTGIPPRTAGAAPGTQETVICRRTRWSRAGMPPRSSTDALSAATVVPSSQSTEHPCTPLTTTPMPSHSCRSSVHPASTSPSNDEAPRPWTRGRCAACCVPSHAPVTSRPPSDAQRTWTRHCSPQVRELGEGGGAWGSVSTRAHAVCHPRCPAPLTAHRYSYAYAPPASCVPQTPPSPPPCCANPPATPAPSLSPAPLTPPSHTLRFTTTTPTTTFPHRPPPPRPPPPLAPHILRDVSVIGVVDDAAAH
jgi:hypothetical protein